LSELDKLTANSGRHPAADVSDSSTEEASTQSENEGTVDPAFEEALAETITAIERITSPILQRESEGEVEPSPDKPDEQD